MAAVYELYPRPDGWGCNWSGLLSRRMSLQIPPSQPQPCVPRETVISLCRSVSSGERDRPGGSNQCRKTFGVSVHRESCSAWVPLLAVPLMSISICYRGDELWVLLFYRFGLECGRLILYISGSDLVGRDPKMHCRSVLMPNANNKCPLTR